MNFPTHARRFMLGALLSVSVPALAGPIPACTTALTLQDLIDFGSQGCAVPDSGRVVSSWTFSANYLVSGISAPASSIFVTIDPVHPPATATPNLFNIEFTGSLPVNPGDTLVLSLGYNLDGGLTDVPGFYFAGLPVGAPGRFAGDDVSGSSSLCVGGVFTGSTCSGTVYERSFNFAGQPIAAGAVSATNNIEFNTISAGMFTVTIPGSSLYAPDPNGLSAFGVFAAAVPEPATAALLGSALLGIALARWRQARQSKRESTTLE